jgi:hypothetical protein
MEKWSDAMATYERHGTRSIIVSRDVVSGKIIAPHAGPTRTEEDFLAHMQAVVASDPKVTRWHVVCDNLNTHQSEALVRWVAQISGTEHDLGKKGEYGILALMPRRAAFLSDPSHKVVFHYTPNHSRLYEANRNLALDPGAQSDQTRFFHERGRSGSQGAGLHRLLQPHHGQALQVDFSRQSVNDLNHRRTWVVVY